MSREEWRSIVAGSNIPLDKSVKRLSGRDEERISFLTLVELAFPGDKPEIALADHTGSDPRTCRRWLDEDNRPPAIALAVVVGEIMRRLR